MIPKIIHYCWLSEDPMPDKIKDCIDSWRRVMPDYTLKLWNTKNFDVNQIPYVKEAYENRKWAFAADYIRLYAIYHDGGIYLDSDVLAIKPFDDFLGYSFFSSMEYHPFQIEQDESYKLIDSEGNRLSDSYISGIQIQAAVMGGQKGNRFVGQILEWYKDRHFMNSDGSLNTDVIAPQIYARVAEQFGYKYKDVEQTLDGNVKIFPSEIFAGNRREATPNSYAIHYCENSWVSSSLWKKLKKYWHFFWFLLRQKIKRTR